MFDYVYICTYIRRQHFKNSFVVYMTSAHTLIIHINTLIRHFLHSSEFHYCHIGSYAIKKD